MTVLANSSFSLRLKHHGAEIRQDTAFKWQSRKVGWGWLDIWSLLLSPEYSGQGEAAKYVPVTSQNRNMPANVLWEPPHLFPNDFIYYHSCTY